MIQTKLSHQTELWHALKFKKAEKSHSVGGGYGLHTITTLLAQHSIQAEIKDSVVLDLGSGEGIQALTALALGAKHVILFESNPTFVAVAKKLLSLNGFEQDRYTVINDFFINAMRYEEILSLTDIGIANIGEWSDYNDKTHLEAATIVRLAPKIRHYITGGYGYLHHGEDQYARNWKPTDRIISDQSEIISALTQEGFSIKNEINGHMRENMNCSRAFSFEKVKDTVF